MYSLRGEGVSLDDIRDLLGHKDRNTTDRYVTSDPKSTLKALTVMPRILRNEPKKTLTIDVQTMN